MHLFIWSHTPNFAIAAQRRQGTRCGGARRGGSAGLWRQETAQLLLGFGSLLFALDELWKWLSLFGNPGPGKANLGNFSSQRALKD